MKIRTRLGLWYGGILLASLTLIAIVLHFERQEEAKHALEDAEEPETAWEEVGQTALIYGLPTAFLMVIGGWWLTRKAFTPVAQLTQAVERIHADNLHEQLPRTGNGDELDRLTELFNAMTARLADSFSSVRQFTLHASHEMKTPLAILHTEAETLLSDPNCTDAQRSAYVSQLHEIQRLAKIVEDLTFLAKADTGQVKLSQDLLRLDELLREGVEDAQVLARAVPISVELKTCDEVMVRGDRDRLRQLVLNLVDNAIKYNHQNGHLTMALEKNGMFATLSFANTGVGISPAALPRVFDRFFRGDSLTHSQIEGSGLGLSIAQWVVQTHGGSIHIASELQGITQVTVSLPVAST